MKDRLNRVEFTWGRFLELRAQFYPITIQQQKEREFLELKMSGSMTNAVCDKCNICMGNLDDLGLKFGINLH